MKYKQKVLIVDDQQINRILLTKILESKYEVLEAANGLEAFSVLETEKDNIQVILLDLIMPEMDGYTFLEKRSEQAYIKDIPVIVTTQAEGKESEIKALEKGATDYITKPYHPAIILQRVINTIALRENAILKNTSERDYLTKLYNKETFFNKVHQLIQSDTEQTYSIVYVNIERFKIVNDFFGEAKGDDLLVNLANIIKFFSNDKKYLAARFNADCYYICMPHDKINELRLANYVIAKLEEFEINLKLNVNFGVYVIKDPTMKVSLMCDRASLAVKNIVGKYDSYIEYYNDQIHKTILEEQEIVNEMYKALQEKQFIIYIQPKFDLNNFSVIGAEALIRWHHPEKGIIPPNKFIPVFEKNGFITELDMYILDSVCMKIRELLDAHIEVVPISVNLSRADIYRPDLCENIVSTLKKYSINHQLIEFEITETSYTQDSEQLIEVVNKLRELGFSISMDDFGTGYSSLNMLSEVPVDLIKIDMRFLKNLREDDPKSTSLIHFIVYMAKWLGLPVIAEGVENIEQVEYLRSVGCYNGQGYFFAKPFPFDEYKEKCRDYKFIVPKKEKEQNFLIPSVDLWSSSSRFSLLFNTFSCPLTLMELKGENLEIIRANKAFYDEIMENDEAFYNVSHHVLDILFDNTKAEMLEQLTQLDENNTGASFNVRVKIPGTELIKWHNVRFTYLQQTTNSKIFLTQVSDISTYKYYELAGKMQEEHMAAILKFSNVAVVDIQLQDKILCFNSIAQELLGLNQLVIQYPCNIEKEFSCIEQKDVLCAFLDQVFAGQNPQDNILLSFIKNGTRRIWIRVHCEFIEQNNHKYFAVCYFENVTHKMAKNEIYQIEMDFRDSIIARNENYLEVDLHDKKVLRCSKHFIGNLGYQSNKPVDSFFSLIANSFIHPEDKDKFLQFVNTTSFYNLLKTGNKRFSFECRVLTPQNPEVIYNWVRVNIFSIFAPITNIGSSFCFIEDLGISEENILSLSSGYKDSKTGFYQNEAMEKIIDRYLLEHSESENTALFYVQLFKKTSASHCLHKKTNYSVVVMSNILRQYFDVKDIIVKIDDFSFGIFIENKTDIYAYLQEKAEQIQNAMKEYNKKNYSNKLYGNIGGIVLLGQSSYAHVLQSLQVACSHEEDEGKICLSHTMKDDYWSNHD